MLSVTRLLSLVAILLFNPIAASANCPHLTKGLSAKMEEYRSYKARNEEQQQRLEASELKCRTDGGSLSSRIAAAAEAESCNAQADAARMNQELTTLGAECERTFAQRHALQMELREAFRIAKLDLDEAEKFMNKSNLITQHCTDELETAKTMVQAFVGLEGRILGVEAGALAAKKDYGTFSGAASTLGKLTASLSAKCGGADNSTVPVAATKGTGAGAATKRAPASNKGSDITGTREAAEDAEKSEAATR